MTTPSAPDDAPEAPGSAGVPAASDAADAPDALDALSAPRGVLVVGQLFVDLVFSELAAAPLPGRETWTEAYGWSPGGIANFAIASARLGEPTVAVAAIGTDPFSGVVREQLVREGVGVDALLELDDWALPVTASLGFAEDRALVTGGVPVPVDSDALLAGPLPNTVCALTHLESEGGSWLRRARERGMTIYADLGWDESGAWDRTILRRLDDCDVFLPNEVEAMAYTRTDSARAAAQALAEYVPLSVVTAGAQGVVAVDAGSGEVVQRAPLRVRARDSTGAGDVFGAALAVAGSRPWSLTQRVDFACLVAGITVSRTGGAAGAPRFDELLPWLDAHPEAAEPGRYDFIRE